MKIAEFFQESNGQFSNTRLNASLAVWTALFLAIYSVMSGKTVDIGFLVTLLAYGAGTKVFQKFAEEKKNGNNKPPTS